MARLMPISRVRSVTLIAIVLMTERPPTTRLMSATPMMMALKIRVVDPTCWSKSALVIVVTWSTSASMRSPSAAGSVPSSAYTMICDASPCRVEGRAPACGGSVARNRSWAAASGTIAVVSGALRVGCRMPTTSNEHAAEQRLLADGDTELPCQVAAQDGDPRSLVIRRSAVVRRRAAGRRFPGLRRRRPPRPRSSAAC